jgi:hypothetical protein
MEADENDAEAIVHKDLLKGISLLKRCSHEGDANCLCMMATVYSGDSRYTRDVNREVEEAKQADDQGKLKRLRELGLLGGENFTAALLAWG